MPKKLVTITWSYSREIELPEDATLDNIFKFPGRECADLGSQIVADTASDLNWKDGEITDIQDIPE